MAHITNKGLNAEPYQPGAGHLNILMKMRYMYWIFFGKSGTMNYFFYDRPSSVVILSSLMYALEFGPCGLGGDTVLMKSREILEIQMYRSL